MNMALINSDISWIISFFVTFFVNGGIAGAIAGAIASEIVSERYERKRKNEMCVSDYYNPLYHTLKEIKNNVSAGRYSRTSVPLDSYLKDYYALRADKLVIKELTDASVLVNTYNKCWSEMEQEDSWKDEKEKNKLETYKTKLLQQVSSLISKIEEIIK